MDDPRVSLVLMIVPIWREAPLRGSPASRTSSAPSKPVIVTEFGICSYAGADSSGGGGHDVIDFSTTPTRIDPGLERDEQLQADHLVELIQIFTEEEIDGGFVFAFSEPSNPWSKDPALDLDRASYGIVQVLHGSGWVAKRAFHAIASAYDEFH